MNFTNEGLFFQPFGIKCVESALVGFAVVIKRFQEFGASCCVCFVPLREVIVGGKIDSSEQVLPEQYVVQADFL